MLHYEQNDFEAGARYMKVVFQKFKRSAHHDYVAHLSIVNAQTLVKRRTETNQDSLRLDVTVGERPG